MSSERREPIRCRATSKTTHERCGRKVKAEGHLCRWHGGANPVVAARQELDARLGRPTGPLATVDPKDAIAQTVAAAKVVVDHLQEQVRGGHVSPEDLEQLRRWLDSLSRFAKTDIDVQASRTSLVEREGEHLVWLLETVLADCGVIVADPQVRAAIRRRLLQSDDWQKSDRPGVPPKAGQVLTGEVV